VNRIEAWLVDGYASIGWEDCEYVRPGMSRLELAAAIARAMPEPGFSKADATRGAGHMDRFLNLMVEGDFMITTDGDAVYVGTIAGGPEKLGSGDGGAMWQRKVAWLDPKRPLERSSLPEEAQASLRLRPTLVDVTAHVAALEDLVGVAQDDNWDEFLHWAQRLYEHSAFDVAERDYKLEIAELLSQARATLASDGDWIPRLRAALGGENNLINWMARDTFRRWCVDEKDAAGRAVGDLWGSEEPSEAAIGDFADAVECDITSGNKVVVASVLLMGLDAPRFPPFRPMVDYDARRLLGISARAKSLQLDDRETYEPDALASDLGVTGRSVRHFLRSYAPREPEERHSRWHLSAETARAVVARFQPSSSGSTAGGRYFAFLELLDEFFDRMHDRGVKLRDRLDAQSLVWWVTSTDPPDDWDEDERAAFLAFQGKETPAVVEPGLFPSPTEEQAKRLHLPRPWLQQAVDLLNEKRQVIFYGPPGTGKTFIAQALAEQVEAAGGDWQLVQFHPAYSYEDFFEGYRPAKPEDGDGLQFDLRRGPLRRLAEQATHDPGRPYLLVIDEINRGNIAKIFGELYFLLEYRDRPIRLQYSPEEPFSLPENLFVIGTMNTADRSIALVDSALRRRFYFFPFLPREFPVQEVLGRWLTEQGYGDEPARLLDALNAALHEALPDDDFAIGPSYFMPRKSQPNLERVWRYAIRPLLEERFYGSRRPDEIERDFGLEAMRQRLREAGELGEAGEADDST
jgi:MoxR-like ATPase